MKDGGMLVLLIGAGVLVYVLSKNAAASPSQQVTIGTQDNPITVPGATPPTMFVGPTQGPLVGLPAGPVLTDSTA